MTTVWVLAGLVVAGVCVALVTAWTSGDRLADLGAVSHQWIAEHRQNDDPRR